MADFVRLNVGEIFHNEYKMAVGRRLGRKICLALCRDEVSSWQKSRQKGPCSCGISTAWLLAWADGDILVYVTGNSLPCDYGDIFAWAILHNATTKCSRRNNSVTLGKRY